MSESETCWQGRFPCADCEVDCSCPCPPVEARERQASIVDEILAERRSQDRKWGEQNHAPAVWMLILGEEVGEAAEEVRASCYHADCRLGDPVATMIGAGDGCNRALESKGLLHALASQLAGKGVGPGYRAEMVQVAAVALSAIECLDRNAGR